jgi:DNA-binding transcriptional regulator YiaG
MEKIHGVKPWIYWHERKIRIPSQIHGLSPSKVARIGMMLTDVLPVVDPEETVPAEWLRSALDTTGVSQIRLAKRLDMDASTISNWKRGKTPLSRSRWLAVKTALGLPSDWTPSTKKPVSH